MKKLICVMIAGMLLLGGCAEPEEKNAVCKVTTDEMTEEMTLQALDDEVLSVKSIMKLPFSQYGISTDEEKALFREQMLEGLHYEGVKVEDKSTADEFIMELTINFDEVSYQDLVALGMMSESDVDSEMISLSKTLEGLTAGGYTCE